LLLGAFAGFCCAAQFRDLEQQLSNTEAGLGKIAHEPFPDYPDLDAPDEEIEGWNQLIDQRTRWLVLLMSRRTELIQQMRRLLGK
jgi:hypothetical protein